MSTGYWIIAFFFFCLFVLVAWEIYAVLRGKPTWSRVVIRKTLHERNKKWIIFWSVFCVILMGVAIWLPLHWWLPCTLWGMLCWLDV